MAKIRSAMVYNLGLLGIWFDDLLSEMLNFFSLCDSGFCQLGGCRLFLRL